jgi:hypothetical protein
MPSNPQIILFWFGVAGIGRGKSKDSKDEGAFQARTKGVSPATPSAASVLCKQN